MTEYFMHEYGARNDPKLQRILLEMGYEGIGLFWSMLEYLYEQDGYIVGTLEQIAFTLHTKVEVLQKLFVLNSNFKIEKKGNSNEFCISYKQVLYRISERQDLSEKRRAAINKRWKTQTDTSNSKPYKSNTKVIQKKYKSNTIKEENIKEENNNISLSVSPSCKQEGENAETEKEENFEVVEDEIQITDRHTAIKMLEILFFDKGVINPEEEYSRFLAHYEKTGWKDGNGNKIASREAALRCWEVKNGSFKLTTKAELAKWRRFVELMTDDMQETFYSAVRSIVRNQESIVMKITDKAVVDLIEGFLSRPDAWEEMQNIIDKKKLIYSQA